VDAKISVQIISYLTNIQLNVIRVNPNLPAIAADVARQQTAGTDMTTITVHTPEPTAEPRGARFIATLAARVLAWFEKVGYERAEAALRQQRLADAAWVRDYAQRFRASDPNFAADLMAAADRHAEGR
jgi:hypothetical protein